MTDIKGADVSRATSLGFLASFTSNDYIEIIKTLIFLNSYLISLTRIRNTILIYISYGITLVLHTLEKYNLKMFGYMHK